MAAPIELRNYLRKFTLDDARSGTQPLRLPVGPMVQGQQAMDLFAPPVIQYRYKEKIFLNGAPKVEWSDWIPVLFVKEGDAGDETPAVSES